MATQYEIQEALANEARRQELRVHIGTLKGTNSITASLIGQLNEMNSQSGTRIAEAQALLVTLEAGAGPGVTNDFGLKSTVTQLLEGERQAAKSAVVDFIKLNSGCTEAEVAAVWNQAAVSFHPRLSLPLQDGIAMGRLYRDNLFQKLMIMALTWEAQRAWVLATPKELIMRT